MAPDGRVVALTLVRTNGGEQFGVARLFRYTTAGNRDGTSAAAMVRSTSPGQARPIGAHGQRDAASALPCERGWASSAPGWPEAAFHRAPRAEAIARTKDQRGGLTCLWADLGQRTRSPSPVKHHGQCGPPEWILRTVPSVGCGPWFPPLTTPGKGPRFFEWDQPAVRPADRTSPTDPPEGDP
jgi:hypothetical protein